MRDKATIRKCSEGRGEWKHKGPFTKISKNFSRCENCQAIIGNELIPNEQ